MPVGQAPSATNPDATPTGPTGPARAITRGGVVDAASGNLVDVVSAPPASGEQRFLRFPGIAHRPRAGHGARSPSPAGAALRSAVVPGWGQWAAGRHGRGLILLVLAVVAVLVPVSIVLAVLAPLLPLLPVAVPAAALATLTAAGDAGRP